MLKHFKHAKKKQNQTMTHKFKKLVGGIKKENKTAKLFCKSFIT